MARAVILLFLIAIATINALPSCGPNEEYTQCFGLCQPKCEDREPICPAACFPGCICIDEHVRNAANECVPLYRC